MTDNHGQAWEFLDPVDCSRQCVHARVKLAQAGSEICAHNVAACTWLQCDVFYSHLKAVWTLR